MLTDLHAGERDWLAAVVAAPLDDLKKLVYADWLEDRGDPRAGFLRRYVEAARTMTPADFPPTDGLPEEWLDLIGYRLLAQIAATSPALKAPALRLARPALRLQETKAKDGDVPVGASKLGGLPDLPPGYAWPPGGDCHAIYNDDTGGTKQLAGFLGQINLAEIAPTAAAAVIPPAGLLSFFCFQDGVNDNPDSIGTKCVYTPDASGLVRTKPPKRLTEANKRLPTRRLVFEETLELPAYPDYSSGGLSGSTPLWGGREAVRADDYSDELGDWLRRNRGNMLGYSRSEGGGDNHSPDLRHLIMLKNDWGCKLHLVMKVADLEARNFDALLLEWVDFD